MLDALSLAPRSDFVSAAARRSQRRLTTLRLKPTLRNGLSLANSGRPFPDALCRVVVPGLLLQHHRKWVVDPFGCLLPSFRPPGRGEDPRMQPVVRSFFTALSGMSGLCSPLGLSTLRFSARPDFPLKSLPPYEARFLSLPEDVSF